MPFVFETEEEEPGRYVFEDEGFSIGGAIEAAGDEIWKGLKTLGVLGWSMAAMPGAGIEAAGHLLPTISTDPGKLIDPGSFAKAEEVLERRLAVPGETIPMSPEEREAAEKTGEIVGWPFEKAGSGIGALIEWATTQDLEKAADVATGESPGSNILIPIGKTLGEAAAMIGAGGKAVKSRLAKLRTGIEAPTIEARLRAGEAKHGKAAIVPEEIGPPPAEFPPIVPKPESKFLKQEFKERFIDEATGEVVQVDKPATKVAQVKKAKPTSFNNLSARAKGAIASEARAKNEPPEAFTTSQWVSEKVSLESLKSENQSVWGDEFTKRGSMTKGPLIVDDKGIVLDGNNRLREAIERGDKEIDILRRAQALKHPEKPSAAPGEEVRGEGMPKVIEKTTLVQKPKYGPQLPKPGDPTLYALPIPEMGRQVGKAYKAVGTKIWDDIIEKKIPKLLEKIPGGKAVNRALIYDYRGDLPNTAKYIRSMEDKVRGQQVGRAYALDLGNRLQLQPERGQLLLGEYIRGEIKALPEGLQGLGNEAKRVMLDLGKQAVDVGLLSEATFFKNAGRYMPRLYTSKEYQTLLTTFNLKKANRLDLSRFKRRKDIPKEIREEMGEILTPGYPIAKGIIQLTHDIELGRWFKGIAYNKDWAVRARKFQTLAADADAKTWGAWEDNTLIGVFESRKEALKAQKGAQAAWRQANPVPDGWEQLPVNKKLGDLSGSYVHPEIHKDLMLSIRIMETPEKVWRKALGMWKFGKVILSPKTHSRNLMSNSVLAHLGGMPMYEQPVYLVKGARQMRTKGNYWQQATKEGLLGTTWTEHELTALFSSAESNIKGIKAGSIPEKLGAIGTVWEKSKYVGQKAAKAYQAEEEWFKLAKFIHNIERKKMTVKAASADAEKWLFNYGKITKFQEGYRSKWYGAPFATFTFKALPRIAEAAVKTPHRFILPGAMIYALEQAAMKMIEDSPEQFKAKKKLRPDWMQGSFLGMPNFARVPFVDDDGREYYLNLTYTLPWGDIGESGSFAGIPGGLMPLSQPFVKETWQQIANYDSFWGRPIVPEEELAGKSFVGKVKTQAAKRGAHLAKTMLPTPVLDIQKGIQAFRGRPDYRGRFRPLGIVAADAFLGIKMYPVDYVDQIIRKEAKLDPNKGFLARKIMSQINRFEIKRKAMEKAGKNDEYYREQIERKIEQLEGLGIEMEKAGALYKTVKGEENP